MACSSSLNLSKTLEDADVTRENFRICIRHLNDFDLSEFGMSESEFQTPLFATQQEKTSDIIARVTAWKQFVKHATSRLNKLFGKCINCVLLCACVRAFHADQTVPHAEAQTELCSVRIKCIKCAHAHSDRLCMLPCLHRLASVCCANDIHSTVSLAECMNTLFIHAHDAPRCSAVCRPHAHDSACAYQAGHTSCTCI